MEKKFIKFANGSTIEFDSGVGEGCVGSSRSVLDIYNRQLLAMQNNSLDALLTERLNELGYSFNHQKEFHDFILENIERVTHSTKPFDHAVYLSIKGQPSILLFTYSTDYKIDYSNPNKITATIG